MKYQLFIAKRYLRSNQRTGFISTITYIAAGGVVLGVAALVIMLSVTNGFSGEVKNRLIGMNAHVAVTRHMGEPIDSHGEVIERISQLPDIIGAAPVVDRKVGIVGKDSGFDGIVVWGIDDSFVGVSDLPHHLRYGGPGDMRLGKLPGQKYNGIILGDQLANRMRVGLGDEVFLMTVQSMDLEEILMGITPKLEPFVITDIFASGMYHYDDNFAFIDLADAQRIFRLQDGVSNIHIRLPDLDGAIQVRDEVDALLGYPYRVVDWTQLFPELFQWMELEKWVIFIALSLIIVVAAFNIMAILIMSTLIKTPEIGILRAMGSTSGDIRRIFVYQGLIIGVFGTALGYFLGVLVCLLQQYFKIISIPGNIYIIDSLPVDMQLLDFVVVGVVSMSICLLAAIYPAHKAARLMPVDAIRYIA